MVSVTGRLPISPETSGVKAYTSAPYPLCTSAHGGGQPAGVSPPLLSRKSHRSPPSASVGVRRLVDPPQQACRGDGCNGQVCAHAFISCLVLAWANLGGRRSGGRVRNQVFRHLSNETVLAGKASRGQGWFVSEKTWFLCSVKRSSLGRLLMGKSGSFGEKTWFLCPVSRECSRVHLRICEFTLLYRTWGAGRSSGVSFGLETLNCGHWTWDVGLWT
jgi:hypothetical protein